MSDVLGLDLVLLVACAFFAWSGYQQGFMVGALGFVGFLGGGVVGMMAAPLVVGESWDPLAQLAAAIALVLVAAAVGQAAFGMVGRAVRRQLEWAPVRLLDSTAGAVLSIVAVLVVSWYLALAVRFAEADDLRAQVRESRVLSRVDGVMPDRARSAFGGFRALLEDGRLPSAFGGLSAERILPVAPPEGAALSASGVRAAAESVVQVTGAAEACGRTVEGSGFVYAPQRVMTNAHVVAGVREPTVRIGGRGPAYEATVVHYDADTDVAVLAVPELAAPPLPFDDSVARGDEGVVAGFPAGGPYRLDPARVRERLDARGPDVYGMRQVTRSVLSLFGVVRPGNSGGPLLSADGAVMGVIFAKSLDDDTTGYALTVDQVSAAARGGLAGGTGVDTGGCART